MELSKLGELGLITLLKKNTIFDDSRIILGIGDDAAAVLPVEKKIQLFTTDMLVEGVHFNFSYITPWQLGYKAVAVNFSDIAAMGGKPCHILVSIALPKHFQVESVVDCYEGMKNICNEFGVNIIGGDTVASNQGVIINIAVIGEIDASYLTKRSGAKEGDVIAITGSLGDAAAGLELLEENVWELYDCSMPLVKAQLTPRPQIKAGQIISAMGASSMCDISDGLANELFQLAYSSNVGMCIEHTMIPWSEEIKQAAEILKKPILNYALYGGDDYQLLFTMSPEKFSRLKMLKFGTKISVIGEVVSFERGVVLKTWDGQDVKISKNGYNHFLNKEKL